MYANNFFQTGEEARTRGAGTRVAGTLQTGKNNLDRSWRKMAQEITFQFSVETNKLFVF